MVRLAVLLPLLGVVPGIAQGQGRAAPDSIALDWFALDGVTVYIDSTFGPAGMLGRVGFLFRYSARREGQGRWILRADLLGSMNVMGHTVVWDTATVELTGDGRAYRVREREAHVSRDSTLGVSDAREAVFEAGEYHVVKGEETSARGIRPGTLTPLLFRAAIAAFPNELPPDLYFPVVIGGGTAFVRVVFGERGVIDLPLAPPGAPCGPNTKVTRRPLAVVWATESTGERYAVLVRRPHVVVQYAQGTLRCVSLPRLDRPGGPAPLPAQFAFTRPPELAMPAVGDVPLDAAPLAANVVEEAPRLISMATPVYPEALRQAGVGGQVMARCIIDTAGRVEPASIRIVSSPHPDFHEPVEAALRSALFRPARVHGRPVRVLVNIPLNFNVRRPPERPPAPLDS